MALHARKYSICLYLAKTRVGKREGLFKVGISWRCACVVSYSYFRSIKVFVRRCWSRITLTPATVILFPFCFAFLHSYHFWGLVLMLLVWFFCSSCIFPYWVFWWGKIGVKAFCAWACSEVVVGAAVLFDKTFFRKLFTCGDCILY